MRHLRHWVLSAMALAGLAGAGGCPLTNPTADGSTGNGNVNDNTGTDKDAGGTTQVKLDAFVKILLNMTSDDAEPVDVDATTFRIDEDAAAFDDLFEGK
ncbi:hypothetical protein RAS1_00080 [Phycisphaerae bacterium RAS1]|nr:hypothetical protein RAS1_00080 [Phycisphaerae bacterium RAS1]